MKFIVLAITLIVSFALKAQSSDLLSLQITEADINKLSENTRESLKDGATDICACIKAHREPFDNFSDNIVNYNKVKKGDDNEATQKAKDALKGALSEALPFMDCMAKKAKNRKANNQDTSRLEEIKKLYPEHADSKEAMGILKSRYTMYYIQKLASKEDTLKFELISNFMFGYVRGLQDNKKK